MQTKLSHHRGRSKLSALLRSQHITTAAAEGSAVRVGSVLASCFLPFYSFIPTETVL